MVPTSKVFPFFRKIAFGVLGFAFFLLASVPEFPTQKAFADNTGSHGSFTKTVWTVFEKARNDQPELEQFFRLSEKALKANSYNFVAYQNGNNDFPTQIKELFSNDQILAITVKEISAIFFNCPAIEKKAKETNQDPEFILQQSLLGELYHVVSSFKLRVIPRSEWHTILVEFVAHEGKEMSPLEKLLKDAVTEEVTSAVANDIVTGEHKFKGPLPTREELLNPPGYGHQIWEWKYAVETNVFFRLLGLPDIDDDMAQLMANLWEIASAEGVGEDLVGPLMNKLAEKMEPFSVGRHVVKELSRLGLVASMRKIIP